MSELSNNQRPRGYLCPVCERFIGPQNTCPYCGEASAKSSLLVGLRRAALILGVLGLALLHLAAAHREIPVTLVETISPMMNFAHVRIVGKVPRNAYVSRKHGAVDYVSFLLDDRTGEVRVTAYHDVAKSLVEQGKVPVRGTWVDAAGTLNVAADGGVKLRLYAAEQLTIKGKEEGQ